RTGFVRLGLSVPRRADTLSRHKQDHAMQLKQTIVTCAEHGINGIDDITLAYTLFEPAGAAKGDIVCVHGLTRQKRDFDLIATHLAAHGYRVFSFDAPRRGESSPLPPAFYDLSYYADIFYTALK